MAEGDSNTTSATFTVTLSDPSPQSVTVSFAAVDDSAQAGSDYIANRGILTFQPEVTTQAVTVVVRGDVQNEGAKTFTVALTGAINASNQRRSFEPVRRRCDPAGPALSGPVDGALVVSMDPVLAWNNPPDVVQYQVQVLPCNSDGPAINLIIGAPEQAAAARSAGPTPKFGEGGSILLLGMTSSGRARTTPLVAAIGEHAPGIPAGAHGRVRGRSAPPPRPARRSPRCRPPRMPR